MHEGFHLGWWLGQQRSLRMNDRLLPERIQALNTLDMVWEHPPHSIEHKLLVARDYTQQHGHLAPRHDERYRGMHLGRLVAGWRRDARERTLPHGYRRALTEIYPWWNADGSAQWKRTFAAAQKAAHASALAFPDLDQPGDGHEELTRWLTTQIATFFRLRDYQRDLLGSLPLDHPLALLLARPRGSSHWAFARGLHAAYAYRCRYQNLDVLHDYCDNTGFPLGRWLSGRRGAPHMLTQQQRDALEALGMRWLRGHERPFHWRTVSSTSH